MLDQRSKHSAIHSTKLRKISKKDWSCKVYSIILKDQTDLFLESVLVTSSKGYGKTTCLWWWIKYWKLIHMFQIFLNRGCCMYCIHTLAIECIEMMKHWYQGNRIGGYKNASTLLTVYLLILDIHFNLRWNYFVKLQFPTLPTPYDRHCFYTHHSALWCSRNMRFLRSWFWQVPSYIYQCRFVP